MDNNILEQVMLFLQNLRCTNLNREGIIHLETCREEKEKLAAMANEYNHQTAFLSKNIGQFFEEYFEQIESFLYTLNKSRD